MERLIEPRTCLGIYQFAFENKFEAIARLAGKYAKFYFQRVSKTQQFLEISVNTLTHLIKDKKTNVHSYDDLYIAIIKWIDFDADQRTCHIIELLSHIPMKEISMQVTFRDLGNISQIPNDLFNCLY